MKDMSPQSWLEVVKRFNTDDHLFTEYYQSVKLFMLVVINHFRYQSRKADPSSCEGDCKNKEICSCLTTFTDGDVCKIIDPNINISQQEIELHRQTNKLC